MHAPPKPQDEDKRLESLHLLNLLDTWAEERFDRYTRLAKRIFDVPIALVSIVDENRQWFKSKQGLDATETSREISFCGHTILDKEVFVVENALNDDRFCDNPLVSGAPDIRFYAGCPLHTQEGYRIGTLCIIDRNPRDFSPQDTFFLQDLGEMVEDELKTFALSITDELTTISNRRGFNQLANYVLNICRRMNKDLCLLHIDLDKFKAINDNFGHGAGDEVLKAMASILLDNFRDSDVIARIGGDEFVVLCSLTQASDIEVVLNRLTKNVDAYNETLNKAYQLLYSVGVINISPQDTQTLDQYLAQADTKMYEAKLTK